MSNVSQYVVSRLSSGRYRITFLPDKEKPFQLTMTKRALLYMLKGIKDTVIEMENQPQSGQEE